MISPTAEPDKKVAASQLSLFCDDLPAPIIARAIVRVTQHAWTLIIDCAGERYLVVDEQGRPCVYASFDAIINALDGIPNLDPGTLTVDYSHYFEARTAAAGTDMVTAPAVRRLEPIVMPPPLLRRSAKLVASA